jgi:hypothetical protein
MEKIIQTKDLEEKALKELGLNSNKWEIRKKMDVQPIKRQIPKINIADRKIINGLSFGIIRMVNTIDNKYFRCKDDGEYMTLSHILIHIRTLNID